MPLSLTSNPRASWFHSELQFRNAALLTASTVALAALAATTVVGAAQTYGARTAFNVQNSVSVVHDRFIRSGEPSTFEIRVANPKGRAVAVVLDGRVSGTAVTSTFPAPSSITVADGAQHITFTSRPSGDMVFNLTMVPSLWGRNTMPLRVAIGSDVTVDTALNVFVTP